MQYWVNCRVECKVASIVSNADFHSKESLITSHVQAEACSMIPNADFHDKQY